MILSFPVGSFHGWGICGKYLSIELNKLYATDEFEHIYHNFETKDFDDLLQLKYFLENFKDSKKSKPIYNHHQTLFAMANNDFMPNMYDIQLKQKRNFGYIFFENNLDTKQIKKASKLYETIFCGSSYNEKVLNNIGITNTKTILQGVDTTIFNSCNNQKILNNDKFVIFSGGKFEYRKAQDVLLSAFKRLQDKYDDVMLIASWFNMWEESIDTMRYSKHIKVHQKAPNQDYFSYINQILANNKIDINKVILYPMIPNQIMPTIYKNSDIGVFPNRCEGGTNLVMMEYMACGKPVIASNLTGHKDIIHSKNAIMLDDFEANKNYKNWQDISSEELYQKLEYAYLNYHKLKKIAKRASNDLSKLTWTKSAKRFKKAMR